MPIPDILFAMTGDLFRNSRALKQLRALADDDRRVHVLYLAGEAPPVALPDLITVEPVHVVSTSGPRFFYEVHRAFLSTMQKVPAHCYHASDLYVLPACAKCAEEKEVLYTFDSRELYAHVSSVEGRPWIGWFWSTVQSSYLPRAATVFTVSKHIASYLEKKYRIPRPVVIHNVPSRSTNTVDSTDQGKLRSLAGLDSDIPIILHLGHVRKARGCDLLVEAMKHVRDAHLIFLGGGPLISALKDQARTMGVSERVSFCDPVSPDAILEHARDASIGISLLQDTCLNHRFALPNKLFDYVAAGVPVLASNLPEIRSIVQGYNVGQVVDQRDPLLIAEKLNFMLGPEADRATWKRNAERLRETFNWEKASQRFIKSFRSILPRKLSQPESDLHP